MENQDEYIKRIRAVYPDLTVYDVRTFASASQFNDILVVNDELVFRFPRYDRDVPGLEREAAALKALQGRLSIPVPEPCYLAIDPAKAGQAFIGYPMLPGKPIKEQRLDLAHVMMDEASLRQMVAQMAGFMDELHRIPPDSLGIDLPLKETRQDIEAMYAGIQDNLFEYMRPEAVEWTKRIFDDYLQHAENFNFQPVLRHGDLGGSNILIDPEIYSVTGVLDFSSVAVGDPAMDLAGLGSISESFYSFLYQVDSAEIKPMFSRSQFYKGTFALQEALAGALDGDKIAFQRGLAPYVSTNLAGEINPNPRMS